MKTFLDSIKARAEAAQATLATADKLTLLELAVDDTKAEVDRYAGDQINSPQKLEAHADWTTATQTAQRVRRSIADAQNVLASCTPILGSVDISFHARLNPIAYVQNDPAGITEGSRCVEGAKCRRPPER